ncbi:hypothetical protein B9Z19DRAFT_1065100 [Tuber borchii]|uniref:Uncharacterized protein n=1 Tax=Tuber borchii TaxID=42251 RepID=A0A2T6ZS94_TUBBO|nr:hypothetical protein B9Z19DRAFT_1065100 [Tuber borchii]
MSMSTNPRFTKHAKVNENNSAAIKLVPRGFTVLIDNRNTGYAPTKEVTMPPCTPHPAFSEKLKEPKKDEYDVPYDEDFDAWFTRWEAKEAQRIIDGAPIKYNEHGQEIDEDLEAYFDRIQMDISSGLYKRNTKRHLGLTDREEPGLVERKRRCLPPPPLLKPDTTDEIPKDTKHIVPAEPEKFRAPMQGNAATATVYQGLCDKTDREQNIRVEVKETAPKAMNAKNASPGVPYAGDDNTATKPPSDVAPTLSIGQSISKPPGWPESLPAPPTSKAWNGRRSSPPVQGPISNSNGEEPSAFCESETPSAIEYYQGIETYIQTDTPYAPGPMTNFHGDPNIISPGNKRGSNSLDGQKGRISSGFYEPGGQGSRKGNGGHAGYRGGRKGRKNRGHGHQRNR